MDVNKEISAIFGDLSPEYSFEMYPLQFSDIKFRPYVQLKCQHCINYGSCFKCPPYTPRFYKASAILSRYKFHYVILMRRDMSYFINLMMEKHNYSQKRALIFASRNWDVTSYWKFHHSMVHIKRLFEDMNVPILIFGPGGGCRLCRKCNVHLELGCKHPDEALASPESWGIDVYGTLLDSKIPIEIPPRYIYTRVALISLNRELEVQNGPLTDIVPLDKKDSFENVLHNLQEFISGRVIDVVDLVGRFSEIDYCEECLNKHRFICDRSFLPREYLRSFISSKKCIVIEFESSQVLKAQLSNCIDIMHRHGYYEALPFTNAPCWQCDDCSSKGCKLTNRQNEKKFGLKSLFRCIKYIGINFITKGNNFGYIVVDSG